MKKLLLVLAIGSLFAVACNDGGSADTENKTDTAAATTPAVDSAAATPDSAAAPAATVDTTKKADSVSKKK